MTAGLGIDRLLDFCFQCLYLLKFWFVVNEYSKIVILTFGRPRCWRGPISFYQTKLRKKFNGKDCRYEAVKGPGVHFIWPFNIEEVIEDNVVPSDLNSVEIDMTLKDGTQLHVELSGRWKIVDMIKFQLENEDADTILENVGGMVQEHLFQYTWEELMEVGMRGRSGLVQKLRTVCNQELREWGAELDRLYIYSFIRTSLRDGVVKVL